MPMQEIEPGKVEHITEYAATLSRSPCRRTEPISSSSVLRRLVSSAGDLPGRACGLCTRVTSRRCLFPLIERAPYDRARWRCRDLLRRAGRWRPVRPGEHVTGDA